MAGRYLVWGHELSNTPVLCSCRGHLSLWEDMCVRVWRCRGVCLRVWRCVFEGVEVCVRVWRCVFEGVEVCVC